MDGKTPPNDSNSMVIDGKTPSINTMRAHGQMMALFAAMGIPVSTAVVVHENGLRVSLPVGEG